jgi:hypothetical protein
LDKGKKDYNLFRSIRGTTMSKEGHIAAVKHLRTSTCSERNLQFLDAIFEIDYKYLSIEEVYILKDLYHKLKDMGLRNKILRCLFHSKDLQIK